MLDMRIKFKMKSTEMMFMQEKLKRCLFKETMKCNFQKSKIIDNSIAFKAIINEIMIIVNNNCF